jgi:very-short-patch-repair endonuclease
LPDKTWKQITRRAKIFGLQRNNFGTKYISSNEKILQKLLDELNITYIFQKRIDYNKNKFYIADFLLNSSNIILEAQGDYWHGNPKVFPVPSNTQLLKIANDAKRKSILEDLGYKVIYIWEYDLIHNYQQCKDIIKALLPV